nr:cell wall hydrolase [Bacillus sp. B15-48]
MLVSFFIAALPTSAYTVKKGDTLTKIAREKGTSLEAIAKVNPDIKNIDVIFVGQEIILTDQPIKRDETYEQEPVVNIDITEDEIDLLARIVRAEAQTEPFEGKVAVADVVLNRVESSKFPDTVTAVIHAPGQFQPVSNGEVNKPADEESYEAVYTALSEPSSVTNESLFFYNPDIATSRWLDTRDTTVIIGDHVFKK